MFMRTLKRHIDKLLKIISEVLNMILHMRSCSLHMLHAHVYLYMRQFRLLLRM